MIKSCKLGENRGKNSSPSCKCKGSICSIQRNIFLTLYQFARPPPPAPHSSHPSAGGICIRNSPIPFSSDEHIKYVTIHASEQSNEINIHKSNITCKRRCPFASEPVPVCLCSHSPLWLFHPESSLAHFGSFAVVFWSILARL